MNNDLKVFLSSDLYYSRNTLHFYKAGYMGLGNTEIRELPTAINSHLMQIVEIDQLDQDKAFDNFCIGRYFDEKENDEKQYDFTAYSVELNPVSIDLERLRDTQMTCSKRIESALALAEKAHARQKRKSDGSAYIVHLEEVKGLLENVATLNDEDVIVAGILHDVVEDTNISKSDLLSRFGNRVTNLVTGLTDDKTKTLEERRRYTIVKLQSAPRSVKLIKLADISSNAAAIPKGWSRRRVEDYFIWLDAIAYICREASESLYQHYKAIRS
ncbi:HD domain-containing protein [Ningiella sp. W23]|uniref:HD domain-containing protein n=1 Tax=Ningiella sp. W23 TaxID=3023715 RepID=UPI0037566526